MSKWISSWLPVFPGFYGTLFEPDLWSEQEYFEPKFRINEFKTIVLKGEAADKLNLWDYFDNTAYEEAIVKRCVDAIKDECPFIIDAKLESISRPREYNFYNDSANVKYKIKRREFKKWIYANRDKLDKYFKARYTSCDGFISSYENSFSGWEEDTKKFTDLEGWRKHYLGALLNAWFEIEKEEPDDWLYEEATRDLYMGEYIKWNEVDSVWEEMEEGEDYDVIFHDPRQMNLFTQKEEGEKYD